MFVFYGFCSRSFLFHSCTRLRFSFAPFIVFFLYSLITDQTEPIFFHQILVVFRLPGGFQTVFVFSSHAWTTDRPGADWTAFQTMVFAFLFWTDN